MFELFHSVYESARVCAYVIFLATLFISARSLNAFHYKTSMRISHRQQTSKQEQRVQILCAAHLIFLCVRQAEKVIVLMPTYTLHYTRQHSLAAVSTASTTTRLYSIQVKPFWIYTYTCTTYTHYS